jgi:hypothetical protein
MLWKMRIGAARCRRCLRPPLLIPRRRALLLLLLLLLGTLCLRRPRLRV